MMIVFNKKVQNHSSKSSKNINFILITATLTTCFTIISADMPTLQEVRINAQMFQSLEQKLTNSIDTKLDFHFKGLSQRFALFLSEVSNMQNQNSGMNAFSLDAEESKMKLSKIEKRQDRLKKMMHASITQAEIMSANQLKIQHSLNKIQNSLEKTLKLNNEVMNRTEKLLKGQDLMTSPVTGRQKNKHMSINIYF